MRKLILLVCCLAFLAIPFGSVLAGNADDCNFLKDKDDPDYAPGLYGICVAWYNTSNSGNEQAINELATKFYEASGLTLPISDGGGDPVFTCRCWSALSVSYVCALGEPFLPLLNLYDAEDPEYAGVYQGGLIFRNSLSQLEILSTSIAEQTCQYTIDNVGTAENLNLNEAEDCGLEIGLIRDLHLTELCPPSD